MPFTLLHPGGGGGAVAVASRRNPEIVEFFPHTHTHNRTMQSLREEPPRSSNFPHIHTRIIERVLLSSFDLKHGVLKWDCGTCRVTIVPAPGASASSRTGAGFSDAEESS